MIRVLYCYGHRLSGMEAHNLEFSFLVYFHGLRIKITNYEKEK